MIVLAKIVDISHQKKRLSIYYWKSPQLLLQFNVLGQRVIMIGSFMPQNVAHFNI